MKPFIQYAMLLCFVACVVSCKKTALEPSVEPGMIQNNPEMSSQSLTDVIVDESDPIRKTSASDPVLGTVFYDTGNLTASSPTAYTFSLASGAAWLPTNNRSYAVEIEASSVSCPLKLFALDNTNAWRRIETNASLAVKKKVIFFSAVRFRHDDQRVICAFYPSSPVTIRMRCYVKTDYGDGPVMNYPDQGWASIVQYVHSQQDPGSLDCGPNTYMIARHLVRPSVYEVSLTALESIKNKMVSMTGYVKNGVSHINHLNTVAKAELGSTNVTLKATSQRLDFNNWVTSTLKSGGVIIIPIALRTSDNTISPVSGSATVGHFILLVGIDRTAIGTKSRIYYKDGLTSDSRTRPVDFSDLLNSNKANSAYGTYSALSLK